MTKEGLFAPIREKYNDLKKALEGTEIDRIKEKNDCRLRFGLYVSRQLKRIGSERRL